MPASAQGNVLRLSRLLADDGGRVEPVGFDNFLAPTAGANEVRNDDALNEHDSRAPPLRR